MLFTNGKLVGHFALKASFTAIFTTLIYTQSAFTMDLDPDKIRVKEPENNMAVVQNKYFEKALRPEIGLFAGRIMNEAYTETVYTGYRLSLFFTENFGMELSSLTTTVEDSPDRKALNELEYREINSEALVTPDPEINTIKSSQEINFFFAPLYGKINVLDQFIIYSDLYGFVGVSALDTDQEDITAINYGIGQRLYLTKSLSFRWDLKLKNYEEKRNDTTSSKTSYNMDFGISYFIF